MVILRSCILTSAVLAVAAPTAARQAASYVVLEEAEEIALALSAAPAHVSAEATVWVLRDGGYVRVVEGTNGNTCFVARTYPESLEPICYDAEATRTILPVEFRRFELRMAGKTGTEIDREIDRAVGAGELQAPRRPAMGYMMSSGQILFASNDRRVGSWHPHLMMYTPYITHQDIGLPEATAGLQVFEAGKPMAHIIIVVPEFVDPVR